MILYEMPGCRCRKKGTDDHKKRPLKITQWN